MVVESEIGKGTVIEIIIPAEPGNDTNDEIYVEEKRIAIFDDDPAVAEVARQMLLRLGHKVVEEDYNIILTDMEMGGLFLERLSYRKKRAILKQKIKQISKRFLEKITNR